MAKRKTKAGPVPLRLEWRSPAELADNPKNWRRHPDAQLAALEGAIAEVGWAGACLYNERTGHLIDGHARRKVAQRQGAAAVPVLVGSWDEATETKILATLDPLSAMAEPDVDALHVLLSEFDTGCPELRAMVDGVWTEAQAAAVADAAAATPVEEDTPPAVQPVVVTRPGDLWTLGAHRLHVGDLRTVLPTLADASIDMVFTDPPYGHNNNEGDLIHNREKALGKPQTKSSAPRPIANDGEEANPLVREMFIAVARLLKPGCCCCCCCGGGGPDPQFARWSLWLDEALPFKMCVVWDKGGLGMGWHYRRCWECILVAEKPGAACHWFGGNDTPNVIRDIGKIIPSADQHPTEKPVALPAWFLRLHSKQGDLVLDPFLGSGSTLMACEQLQRACIGVEVDGQFADMAIRRYAAKFPAQPITRHDGKPWAEVEAKAKR